MRKSPKNRKRVILDSWDFNRIYTEDKEIFIPYIKETEYPTNLWTSNFDFLWGISRKRALVLWKIIDEMLVVFMLSKKKLNLLCLPFGKGDPNRVAAITRKCLRFCYSYSKNSTTPVVMTINDLQLEYIRRSSLFRTNFLPIKKKGQERHVSIHNLINLRGKQFNNVRYMINRFKRKYPNYIVRRATKDDYNALIDLKNKWNEKSGIMYKFIWDDYFYERIIRYFDELDHTVIVVEDAGEIYGVITGGLLPHGEAWACELKQNKEIPGICEVLYVELAKVINNMDPNAQLLNLGNDFRGKGGLRFFKEKLRPVLNTKVYKLLLKL